MIAIVMRTKGGLALPFIRGTGARRSEPVGLGIVSSGPRP